MFRTASKGIGALVTSLALMSIAGLPAHAASTKLVYGNVTEMTLSQAPMVAAKRLGYFKAEGLEVELMGFKGTGTLIPQMLAGRVDIGYPNPDTLIISREPGKEHLPLKFFYNMTRSSGWEFVVPAEFPAENPARSRWQDDRRRSHDVRERSDHPGCIQGVGRQCNHGPGWHRKCGFPRSHQQAD